MRRLLHVEFLPDRRDRSSGGRLGYTQTTLTCWCGLWVLCEPFPVQSSGDLGNHHCSAGDEADGQKGTVRSPRSASTRLLHPCSVIFEAAAAPPGSPLNAFKGVASISRRSAGAASIGQVILAGGGVSLALGKFGFDGRAAHIRMLVFDLLAAGPFKVRTRALLRCRSSSGGSGIARHYEHRNDRANRAQCSHCHFQPPFADYGMLLAK